MIQLALFDSPACASARRNDPLSSHRAARDVERWGTAQSHRDRILGHVRLYPGLTSKEIAEALGMDRHAVARRLPEMRANGQVTCKIGGIGKDMTWYAT